MKKLIFVGLAALIFAFSACSSQSSNETDTTAPVQTKAPNPLLTKKGLEKKLTDFGIPAYPKAEFEKIKSADGEYTISYNLPDMTQAGREDADKYFEKTYKKLMDDGWKRFDEIHAIFSKHKQMVRFKHLYKPELNMHKIYTTYGLME